MSLHKPAPFNRLLGLQLVHCSAERSEAQLSVREELCNGFGVLHGGAVMALGDTLGGMTVIAGLSADGRTVQLADGPRTLHTAGATVESADMSGVESLLQVVTDPTVAYILISLGSLGLFLELSNPGSVLPGPSRKD